MTSNEPNVVKETRLGSMTHFIVASRWRRHVILAAGRDGAGASRFLVLVLRLVQTQRLHCHSGSFKFFITFSSFLFLYFYIYYKEEILWFCDLWFCRIASDFYRIVLTLSYSIPVWRELCSF